MEADWRFMVTVPVPSSDSDDIALDLSAALKDMGNAGSPPLPLIRFAPVHWQEGYTRT